MFVRVYSDEMKVDLLKNNWVVFKTSYKSYKSSFYYFYIKDMEYLKKFPDGDYEITNKMTF